MQLAPGPIPQIPSDTLIIDTSDPGFSDLVQSELIDLPTILASMDLLVDPLAIFADDLPDDGSAVILDAVDSAMGDVTAADFTDDLVGGDQALQNSGNDFVTAMNATPAEAFAPVPTPGSFSAPPPPVPIQVPQGQIAILNLSRPNMQPFQVGDNYQIVVSSAHTTDNAITFDYLTQIVPTFNNTVRPTITLPYDAVNNNWHFEGTFGAGDVGVWSDELTVYAPPGFNLPPAVGPQLNFQVVAGPNPTQPTQPRPVAAQFVIPGGPVAPDMAPGLAVIHVGGSWTLTITGAPKSVVIIDAEQNGVQLQQIPIGTTDANGNLVLQGTMATANIGTWVETYTVGGIAWGHTFQFIVAA